MVSPAPLISAISTALPPVVTQHDLWNRFFSARSGGRRSAQLAFRASGVERRHAVVNPIEEDISEWSTGARMERFVDEAMPLGKEAILGAIERASLDPDEIGMLVTVSCTGYATPGIDVRLARDLGMSPDLKRIFVGHVGCHAALPALDVARNFVAVQERPAVLLCLELPSLHLQPASTELEDVVVHALFSDAASALVLESPARGRGGFSVLDSISMTDSSAADAMTWTITNTGFRMSLSRHIPDIVAASVGPLVDQLLARNDLGRLDVDHWAVHPGGPRILDVVADRLGLGDDALAASRKVLANHGNCSSTTMLLVLEELAVSAASVEGDYVVAISFGPGLTLCGALLRTTGRGPE